MVVTPVDELKYFRDSSYSCQTGMISAAHRPMLARSSLMQTLENSEEGKGLSYSTATSQLCSKESIPLSKFCHECKYFLINHTSASRHICSAHSVRYITFQFSILLRSLINSLRESFSLESYMTPFQGRILLCIIGGIREPEILLIQ